MTPDEHHARADELLGLADRIYKPVDEHEVDDELRASLLAELHAVATMAQAHALLAHGRPPAAPYESPAAALPTASMTRNPLPKSDLPKGPVAVGQDQRKPLITPPEERGEPPAGHVPTNEELDWDGN